MIWNTLQTLSHGAWINNYRTVRISSISFNKDLRVSRSKINCYLVQDHDVGVQLEVTRHVETPLLRHGEVGHPGVLHLTQPEVLNQRVNPALTLSANQKSEHSDIRQLLLLLQRFTDLGVPSPGECARLPHQGVEQDGLPHGHVTGEVDVPVHQRHPVLQPARGHAATIS